MESQKPQCSQQLAVHPCLTCGACCSYFRVSLPTSETSPESFHVPLAMVVLTSAAESVMKGTDTLHNTRCVALAGTVGKDGNCTIYENRPSACRKFEASYEYGVKEPRCDEARAVHGLLPLTHQDYDAYRNRSKPLTEIADLKASFPG